MKNHQVSLYFISSIWLIVSYFDCLEPPITPEGTNDELDATGRRKSRFELRKIPSLESATSSSTISATTTRWEVLNLTTPGESSGEEPLQVIRCHLRKSKKYNGYGLVLKYQQSLHVIGEVEKASPAYRAGLRQNDVILFVGKTNVEKLIQ